MKTSLDEVMLGFARFLSASWSAACDAATMMEQVESAEFMSDWAQANWELLVETPFREMAGFGAAFLEPYGEGADCNDSSSRVWLPDVLPTHRIVCRSRENVRMRDLLTGDLIDTTNSAVLFDHFAVRSECGWHEQMPPFDCVMGHYDNREILVSLDQLLFLVEEV